ncbi:MAG: sarcosine oxidase subunit gamma [Proteobacteria bacterium]|nr:sarcosine oxidase subunit gamma [Pseudomonadota bacterium]
MVEAYLRQSPLAHLGLDGRAEASRGAAGVTLAERPHRGMVNLRLDPSDETAMNAFAEAFGFALPTQPNTTAGNGEASALWLGPDEWWIVSPSPGPGPGPDLADKLRAALADRFAAVTEVGESRTCIRIAGPKARALVQKGCPLDVHPRAFGAGQCAQTLLAKATVAIDLVADESAADGPAFEVYVLRSFAEYLWIWLEDAGREYGVTVIA